MNDAPLTESELRAIRDRVFEAPSGDHNWRFAREYWMRPSETAWLKSHDFPTDQAAVVHGGMP